MATKSSCASNKRGDRCCVTCPELANWIATSADRAVEPIGSSWQFTCFPACSIARVARRYRMKSATSVSICSLWQLQSQQHRLSTMRFAAAEIFRIAEHWISRRQHIFVMNPATTKHGYVVVGTHHPMMDSTRATQTERLLNQRRRNGTTIFISAIAASALLALIRWRLSATTRTCSSSAAPRGR